MKAKLVVALSVLALLSSLQGARAEKPQHGKPGSPQRLAYCFAELRNCKDRNNRVCREAKDPKCEERVNKACTAAWGSGSPCMKDKIQ